jgi:hypothetical protein
MPSRLLYLKQGYFRPPSLYIPRVISVFAPRNISAIYFPSQLSPYFGARKKIYLETLKPKKIKGLLSLELHVRKIGAQRAFVGVRGGAGEQGCCVLRGDLQHVGPVFSLLPKYP